MGFPFIVPSSSSDKSGASGLSSPVLPIGWMWEAIFEAAHNCKDEEKGDKLNDNYTPINGVLRGPGIPRPAD